MLALEALREHGLVDRSSSAACSPTAWQRCAQRAGSARRLVGARACGATTRATRDCGARLRRPARATARTLPRRAARAIRAGRCDALMAHWRVVTAPLVERIHAAADCCSSGRSTMARRSAASKPSASTGSSPTIRACSPTDPAAGDAEVLRPGVAAGRPPGRWSARCGAPTVRRPRRQAKLTRARSTVTSAPLSSPKLVPAYRALGSPSRAQGCRCRRLAGRAIGPQRSRYCSWILAVHPRSGLPPPGIDASTPTVAFAPATSALVDRRPLRGAGRALPRRPPGLAISDAAIAPAVQRIGRHQSKIAAVFRGHRRRRLARRRSCAIRDRW